jgi:hypothetical protein
LHAKFKFLDFRGRLSAYEPDRRQVESQRFIATGGLERDLMIAFKRVTLKIRQKIALIAPLEQLRSLALYQ